MRKCWREDPEERPTFSQLSSIVERLLTSIAGYTELSMVLLNTIQEEEQLSKCRHNLFETLTCCKSMVSLGPRTINKREGIKHGLVLH